MNGLSLPPRIPLEDARRVFTTPRAKNLYGLWLPKPVKRNPDGTPSSLELLWMPAYAFRLALALGSRRSSTWVSVDASFGGFSLFERIGILEEHSREGEAFPPVLDIARAEQLARHGLLRYLLRRRGAKPLIESTEHVVPYHAPVWAYYFYRRGKKIDFALIDGYSGTPMGSQAKTAIINAFVAKRNACAKVGE